MEVYQRMAKKPKTNPMGDTFTEYANITIKKTCSLIAMMNQSMNMQMPN